MFYINVDRGALMLMIKLYEINYIGYRNKETEIRERGSVSLEWNYYQKEEISRFLNRYDIYAHFFIYLKKIDRYLVKAGCRGLYFA